MRAEAAPAPIVFDFEDGLQGWELHGSAQRVQTQVLGGEWAIFGETSGERRASIEAVIDLTHIAAISWTQLYTGTEDRTTFLGVSFDDSSSGLQVAPVVSLPGPDENPGTRRSDVPRSEEAPFIGPSRVRVFWLLFQRPDLPGPSVGLIDNVTFHPVPEPSTLALLAVSLAVFGIARRRRRLPRASY